jgi:hypothetical protein
MMESGICWKAELPCPAQIDLAAAAHYFGVQGEDAAANALLRKAAPKLLAAAAPRMVWRYEALEKGMPLPELFTGKDIAAHLAGCRGFALLGVTLGAEADAAIRRAGVGDVAAGAAADALASALAEQMCDLAQQRLEQIFATEESFLTARYSPGYGDWPLQAQKEIARLLELPKSIGVTVTDTCLMLPRKSVTAVLGAADRPVSGHRAGCETCALRGRCAYRKKGQSCENDTTAAK